MRAGDQLNVAFCCARSSPGRETTRGLDEPASYAARDHHAVDLAHDLHVNLLLSVTTRHQMRVAVSPAASGFQHMASLQPNSLADPVFDLNRASSMRGAALLAYSALFRAGNHMRNKLIRSKPSVGSSRYGVTHASGMKLWMQDTETLA